MGDDGTFFISYQDFLKFYPVIDRIRLIGPEWTVTQQWTSVQVPWTVDYLDTSFKLTVTKKGPVVLVLSQPDVRYFKGLSGRYKYSLHFRLYKDGEDTYLLRSMDQSGNMRSCNAETELEPGTYELLLKITAERFDEKKTPEQVIRDFKDERREKILNVGKSFDLAHSKGKLRDLEKTLETTTAKEDLERNRRSWARSRERKMRDRTREKAKRKRLMTELEKKRTEKKKRDEEKRKKFEEEEKKKKAERDQKRKEEHEARHKEGKCNCKSNGSPSESDGSGDEHHPRGVPRNPAPTEGENSSSTAPDAVLTPEPSSPSTLQDKPKEEETVPFDDTDALPPKEIVVFEPVIKAPEKTAETTIQTPDQPEPSPKEVTEEQPSIPSPPRVNPAKYKADHESSADLRSYLQPPPFHPPGPRQRGGPGDVVIIPHHGRGPPPGGMPPRMIPMRGRSYSNSRSRSNSPMSSICEDDFPWDDAIDGPPSPLSESDSESDYNSADEMYPGDPWQASCVIGLRVCSMDENAKIEILKGVSRGRKQHGKSQIFQGRARSPA